MKRVLITGGAGFVGSSLALVLAQRNPNWRIVALDNLRRRGSELGLQRLRSAGVEFIHGDVRHAADLDAAALKPELILECSAEPSVLAGYASPRYMLDTNLLVTINCLELARQTHADFLFLSTSRVYPISRINELRFEETSTRFRLLAEQPMPGATDQGVSEQFPLDGARSIYGASKLASELLITEYAAAYGLRTLINRCGVITGPWQMGKVDQGVFALWMACHYFERPLQYIGYGGTGKQVRDFLHIADVADLVCLQIQAFEILSGETFNVGGGAENALSLLETTRICRELTGHHVAITPVPEARAGDVPIFITDSRKVISRTGWKPRRDLETTLHDIYRWIDDNAEQLATVLFP